MRIDALSRLEEMTQVAPKSLEQAAGPLEELLDRLQLLQETECEHVASVILAQTKAAKILSRLQVRVVTSMEQETRPLLVTSAKIRAVDHAVSTSLVRLRLWPSPVKAGDSPHIPRGSESTQGVWFEELEPGVAISMLEIPSGRFEMGAPSEEEGYDYREAPLHEVELEGFFLSQTPITQTQWRVVAEGGKIELDLTSIPSELRGPDRPMVNVSWDDAVRFCHLLSQFTGRRYSLPSEAQWEYACRSKTRTPFCFGIRLITELSNYNVNNNYANHPKGSNLGRSTDVGSYPANALGLQDMHGNVWEWCEDHWHDNYDGAPKDGNAWVDSSAAGYEGRLLRGGAWNGPSGNCRSAYRSFHEPMFRSPCGGFRICCLP